MLNRHYVISEYDEDQQEHYTNVVLAGPVQPPKASVNSIAALDPNTFLDPVKVADAVRRTCPCEIDPDFRFRNEVLRFYEQHELEQFPVMVDGVPIFRSFPSTLDAKSFKTGPLLVGDETVAYYWQALNETEHSLKPKVDQLIGFRVYQRAFALPTANPYTEDEAGSRPLNIYSYLKWHVGEIHVVTPDLRPDLRRGKFEESEIKRQFVRSLRDWYQRTATETRKYSEERKKAREYDGYSREIESMEGRGAPLSLDLGERDRLREIRQNLIAHEQEIASAKERKAGGTGKGTRDGKLGGDLLAALRKTKPQRNRLLERIGLLVPDAPVVSSSSADRASAANVTDIVDAAAPAGRGNDETNGTRSGGAASPRQPEAGGEGQNCTPSMRPSTLVDADDDDPDGDVENDAAVSTDIVLALLEEILAEEAFVDTQARARITGKLRNRLLRTFARG